MPLVLPRLTDTIVITEEKSRKATRVFSRFWESAMGKIEANENTQTTIITDLSTVVSQQAAILAGGVAFTSLNVNGEVVTALVTAPVDIGLGSVEDKSAATILSELTALNVTTALTYTPVNKAGDTMSGALGVTQLNVSGTKVVGAQGAAVADAAGGATVDVEGRAALNALLARLRTHGLIA